MWKIESAETTCEAAPVQIEGKIANDATGERSEFYFRTCHRNIRLDIPECRSDKAIVILLTGMGETDEWSDIREPQRVLEALITLLPDTL